MSRLKGYIFNNAGTAVEGATVTALEAGTTTAIGSTVESGSDGSWSFTSGLTGKNVDVKIESGSTVRYLKHDDHVQIEHMWVRSDTGATTTPLRVENATNNASNSVLELVGDNSTRADNDEIYISFKLDNDNAEETEFARITAEANDVSNGNEDGEIRFSVMKSGALTEVWNLNSSTSGATSMDMNVDSFTIGSGADTDITLTFDANTSDGVITWMEDEDYFQYSDDILMNSTEKILFGDSGTFIHQSADGVLTIESDTTVDINGAVALNGAVTGATNITLSGELDAATLDISGDADIDGTANLDNTDIDGTLVVDGSNISLDSTSTLNIDNSNTSNGVTIGTATSGVPISIGHSTSETTINYNLTVTGNFTVNGTTTTVNSTTTTVDDPIFTLGGDSAPGSDDNKDRGIEFRYHDGSSARVGFFGFDDSAGLFTGFTVATNSSEVFSGTDISAKFGSLLLSSVSNAGTDTDKFLVLDGSGNVDFRTGAEVLSDIGGASSGSGMSNFILEDGDGTEVTVSDGKEVKFVEGGGLDINWTDTDNGTDADPYDLTFTIASAQTGITSLLATDIKIGEDDETKIDFETADEIHFYANNTEQVYLGDNIFGPQSDSDVDLGATGVRWKDAFVDSITVTGEVDGATLDISGDADIDGTTNLDAVDIDGAVQLDSTLTIGANDQGYDVILYGDTASANLTWDTSADDLILNGGAGLIVPDSQLTLGSTAVTSTGAELNLLDGGTSVGGSITVGDSDGFIVNDGGTMKTIPATDVKTYAGGGGSIYTLKTETSLNASALNNHIACDFQANADYMITITLSQSSQSGTPYPYILFHRDNSGTDSWNGTSRFVSQTHGEDEDTFKGSPGAKITLTGSDTQYSGVIQTGSTHAGYFGQFFFHTPLNHNGTNQATDFKCFQGTAGWYDMNGKMRNVQIWCGFGSDGSSGIQSFTIEAAAQYPTTSGGKGGSVHGSNSIGSNSFEGMVRVYEIDHS